MFPVATLAYFKGRQPPQYVFLSFWMTSKCIYKRSIDAGLNMYQSSIYLILLADGALIDSGKTGLQDSLSSLYSYCYKKNLTLNVDKNDSF